MKKTIVLFTLLMILVFAASAVAQGGFGSCTGAFLDKKLVVDEYTTSGKCILSHNATGELTVCTAELSPQSSIPKDEIEFKIAIRDKNTGTLMMYSGETFKKIDIQKVMTQCTPGDHIVLLTMSREFALPHNEILVK